MIIDGQLRIVVNEEMLLPTMPLMTAITPKASIAVTISRSESAVSSYSPKIHLQ